MLFFLYKMLPYSTTIHGLMTTYIDQLGRSIYLPQCPQRIVSLVPSQTELLHYWGLGDQVVGITKFCLHPEAWYRSKKRVGGTKMVDFERLGALKPDLIIGNKEENSQGDIEALYKQYPVWMSDIYTLADAFDMMQRLGDVVGKTFAAKRLVERLTADFLGLVPIGQEPLRVAYFIWRGPWMVAAPNTFINDLLKRGGWRNAFDHQTRYPIVTEAEIQKAQPDVVFLSSEPYPFKEKHKAELEALCPKAQVLTVDGELFSWYGSRLLHTADYIKNLWQKLVE